MSVAIRTGHIVKSTAPEDADVLFRVTYVRDAIETPEAELKYLDDNSMLDGYVNRPLAMLRRVVDPRNKRPPIEGLPAERPRCPWCDRRLRMVTDNVYNKTEGGASTSIARRIFRRWSAYEGVFCTSGCAIRFAGASYRGGYRRKK